MNFGLPRFSWFSSISAKKDVAMLETVTSTTSLLQQPEQGKATTSLLGQPKQRTATTSLLDQPEQGKGSFDIRIWTWSLRSVIPWAANADEGKQKPTTINRGLKRHALSRRSNGLTTVYRFRPYVCKIPWHTGTKAFLSQLFPRYGHYCGPNWSSGKDGGSLVWDQRPIDWLDHCCYCHDIGYDTHDQAELLKANTGFLECLESNKRIVTRGDAQVAHFYKTMCITASQEHTYTLQKLPCEDTIRAKSTRLWLDIEQSQQENLEFSEELIRIKANQRYSAIVVSVSSVSTLVMYINRKEKESNKD